jgi:hypothetical protein
LQSRHAILGISYLTEFNNVQMLHYYYKIVSEGQNGSQMIWLLLENGTVSITYLVLLEENRLYTTK